jgi:hypothetical protein
MTQRIDRLGARAGLRWRWKVARPVNTGDTVEAWYGDIVLLPRG